mgnify:CR=1 FL=1
MKTLLALLLLIPSFGLSEQIYLNCVLKELKYSENYISSANSTLVDILSENENDLPDRQFMNVIIKDNTLFIEKAWEQYLGEIPIYNLDRVVLLKEEEDDNFMNYKQSEYSDLKHTDLNEEDRMRMTKINKFNYIEIKIHRYNLDITLNYLTNVKWLQENLQELKDSFTDYGIEQTNKYKCMQKNRVI